MANGGSLGDVRVLSESAVSAMMSEPLAKKDGMIPGLVTNFTQGGINVYK